MLICGCVFKAFYKFFTLVNKIEFSIYSSSSMTTISMFTRNNWTRNLTCKVLLLVFLLRNQRILRWSDFFLLWNLNKKQNNILWSWYIQITKMAIVSSEVLCFSRKMACSFVTCESLHCKSCSRKKVHLPR